MVSLAAADRILDRADDGTTCPPAFWEACELSKDAREEMWTLPPPNLAALAWKLEQAMVREGIEDEPECALFWVLRDLRSFAGAN